MMHLLALGAGAAAVGGLYALDRVANEVVRPRPRRPDAAVEELGLLHEDLVIPSGKHALRGWLLRPGEAFTGTALPMVLLAHGWGAHYGVLLDLAEPLVAAGHPVLLFDVRGHGRNEEVAYVTVRHFRDDVAAVARYAAERFPERPRVVVGHSMGGAASVLAAADGAPVHGVVTLAAPADVLEATATYLTDKGFPGGFMVVALRPFWWRRVGGTFRHLVPERRMTQIPHPVLVLHAERDRRVALHHARRLVAGAGRGRLHVIGGAGHTDILTRPETVARLLTFLEEVESGVTPPVGGAEA